MGYHACQYHRPWANNKIMEGNKRNNRNRSFIRNENENLYKTTVILYGVKLVKIF